MDNVLKFILIILTTIIITSCNTLWYGADYYISHYNKSITNLDSLCLVEQIPRDIRLWKKMKGYEDDIYVYKRDDILFVKKDDFINKRTLIYIKK